MSLLEQRTKADWQALDSDHYMHPFTNHKDKRIHIK